MAIEKEHKSDSSSATASGADFGGRHLWIGANVVLGVLIATAIVVLAQWGAFRKNVKFDLTNTGVNSLTPGTEKLIQGLDQKIRLTGMYFQTDLEAEDQAKYRRKVEDLLALYQSANRSLVETETFNPLQDHAKRERLIERLYGLEKFKEQSQPHRDEIDKFRHELASRVSQFFESELESVLELEGQLADESEKDDLSQIQSVLDRWQRELGFVSEDIEEAIDVPQPRFGAATTAIATYCSNLARDLNAIVAFVGRRQPVSSPVADYFDSIETRYRPLVNALESEASAARELPAVELEAILRQMGPTSNTVIVETQREAKTVTFSQMWAPLNPNAASMSTRIADRVFKGEEKITSAVLQLTQEEKTAVVFVRYGGSPLFFGGMPGQGRAPYTQLKELLEDANFVVKEWNVQSTSTPPEIDPPPVRTIHVVLRPTPSPMGMQMQAQQPPFGNSHRQNVLDQLGEAPRAIFLAGWQPGPFGAFPEPYQYESYLNEEWGIHVSSNLLLLDAIMGQRPGEYFLAQRSLFISEFALSDHLLVRDLGDRPALFTNVSPLELASQHPEGATVERLVWCEKRESLWGVKNIQAYMQKMRPGQGVAKEPDDPYGPFTLAAAATKGEGKIVVLGSNDFMSDRIAMASMMALTSRGLTLRQRNPGNVHLILNTLRWLNDQTEWMDVGKPVEMGTINIKKGPALSLVKTMVGGVWPAMALVCGLGVWWVRRR